MDKKKIKRAPFSMVTINQKVKELWDEEWHVLAANHTRPMFETPALVDIDS